MIQRTRSDFRFYASDLVIPKTRCIWQIKRSYLLSNPDSEIFFVFIKITALQNSCSDLKELESCKWNTFNCTAIQNILLLLLCIIRSISITARRSYHILLSFCFEHLKQEADGSFCGVQWPWFNVFALWLSNRQSKRNRLLPSKYEDKPVITTRDECAQKNI